MRVGDFEGITSTLRNNPLAAKGWSRQWLDTAEIVPMPITVSIEIARSSFHF
jgi:hypothetical protein